MGLGDGWPTEITERHGMGFKVQGSGDEGALRRGEAELTEGPCGGIGAFWAGASFDGGRNKNLCASAPLREIPPFPAWRRKVKNGW